MKDKLRIGSQKLRCFAGAFWLLLLTAGLSFSILGCQNVLLDIANKTSDDALYYKAQQQINSTDYDGAVTTIQSMSNGGRASRPTLDLLASAYAGSCGLNLLGLTSSLSSLGTSTLFQSLLTEYRSGVAAQVAKCVSAETVLSAISTRTSDEELLLSFTELVKIGRQLSIDADTDADGFADASFAACSVSDADATVIGTGLTKFLSALAASHLSIASSLTTSIGAMCTTIDTELAQLSPGYSGFCAKTSFSSTELKAIKTLISSSEVGLKSCHSGSGDFASCVCP